MKSGLATASFRWQEMDRNLLIFQGFFISLDCVLNNIAILVDTEKKKQKISYHSMDSQTKTYGMGSQAFITTNALTIDNYVNYSAFSSLSVCACASS